MTMSLQRMNYVGEIDAAALRELFAAWHGANPAAGVMALLPEAEKDKVAVLQEAARAAGLPLVGAVFPALVVEGGFCTAGVQLLRFERMPHAALIPDLNQGPQPAADKIAAALRGHLPDGPATLFMVFDSMVPNIATILDGIYLDLANRVRYAGVNAGSETFQPMPCLFDNERIVGDGVLCLLLAGHPGAALEHGYLAPDEIITATATEGNRIISIDWRPAFDVYAERIRSRYGVEVTRDNFYQLAVHFPFGIVLASDDVLVRIPVALQDDGSLFCVGEIPANSILTLLQSPQVDSPRAVEHLAQGLDALGPPHDAMLIFYCAGRRMHLGAGATDELALLYRRVAARPLAGALSLGEIGNAGTRGYPQFHNAALVLLPWPGA
jgi:hypothetical protein